MSEGEFYISVGGCVSSLGRLRLRVACLGREGGREGERDILALQNITLGGYLDTRRNI